MLSARNTCVSFLECFLELRPGDEGSCCGGHALRRGLPGSRSRMDFFLITGTRRRGCCWWSCRRRRGNASFFTSWDWAAEWDRRVFADRRTLGRGVVCRFRQVGSRVLVIAENSSFRAERGSSDLKKSVELSFPTSVLAALPVEAEQDGTLVVNARPLVVRDAADLLSQMRRPTQAVNGQMVRQEAHDSNWKLEDMRSVVDLDASGSFPRNTEIEALLTFTNDGEVDFNQPDAHSLSVREHHSFRRAPGDGVHATRGGSRGLDSSGKNLRISRKPITCR